MWRRLALALLCLTLSDGPALRSQTAPTLRGVVLTPDGQGIPGVNIFVQANPTLQTVTNDRGEFFVEGLAPARYVLTASKPGYARDDRVKTNASHAAFIWVTSEGVSPSPLVIRMQPQAIVGGRIFDQNHDPLSYVRVTLYRYDRDRGSFRLIQKNGGYSDDRGVFRLTGILSGRYYLIAEVENGQPPGTMISTSRVVVPLPEMRVPTFYPGAVQFSKAVPIDLEAGAERLDLDIQVSPQPMVHIKGIVLDEAGQPLGKAEVLANPAGPGFDGVAVSRWLYHSVVRAGKDGRFDFDKLPAGTYVLRALGFSTSNPNGLGSTRTGGEPTVFGSTTVTTNGVNLDGVTVQVRSPQTLHGLVRFEDGEPAKNVSIQFQADHFTEAEQVTSSLLGDFETRSASDGAFTFPDAWAAEFDVSVSQLPPGRLRQEFDLRRTEPSHRSPRSHPPFGSPH